MKHKTSGNIISAEITWYTQSYDHIGESSRDYMIHTGHDHDGEPEVCVQEGGRMKFSQSKKQAVKMYILEKIEQEDPSLIKTVTENLGLNQSTVHTYINEMLSENIIRKVSRGKYEPVIMEFTYELKRNEGDFKSDMDVLDNCLNPHIKEFPANVRQIWEYAFSEMMNNVIDHSGAEQARVEILQDYHLTTVYLFDDGVGIFRKIKEYFGMSSVDEVICELFKGKLTTDSVNHSGEGIFFSSKMMDYFYIISDGKVFTNNKFNNDRIASITSSGAKGTCVVMVLANETKRTAQEIFDQYADVDGGFVKTRIPMKSIFETAPISRSQAKRVYNRLDKFREIEIDFDEVQWMGQGFAHQLFVVYAASHPEIRIVPTHMNTDVQKMYNHVRSS